MFKISLTGKDGKVSNRTIQGFECFKLLDGSDEEVGVKCFKEGNVATLEVKTVIGGKIEKFLYTFKGED